MLTPEVIMRALLRTLLQLSILYSVVSTFHKLLKISQKVYRNFFKCCSSCYKEIKKKILLLSSLICSADAKVHESKISKHFLRHNQRC